MKEKDLNGKALAKKITEEIRWKVSAFHEEYKIIPRLAMVQVGEDPASNTYIKSKQKICKKVGIETEVHLLPETSSLEQLRVKMKELSDGDHIHGIILEMPIPAHIPYFEAVRSIDPYKDVDCLNPVNLGELFMGDPLLIPNTPKSVMRILKEYNIPLQGKEIVIVGRSLPIGKPLWTLLLAENATVTTCHTKTRDLCFHTSRADILIVCAGKPKLITPPMVKEGAVVIDVGINVTHGGITGDVDYEGVYAKVERITPVPGGVGPVTAVMITENILKTARMIVAKKNPYHIRRENSRLWKEKECETHAGD